MEIIIVLVVLGLLAAVVGVFGGFYKVDKTFRPPDKKVLKARRVIH
ncbi:MAG: hypothetical protein LBC53_00030 [Spirochaetaceae bacterium]|nr:hypothetical protein [Spirochaetaceae bacterium]